MSREVSVWLTVDFVAKRYGVLPSQLLKQGDAIDLKVAEMAVNYEKFVTENPGIKTDHGFSSEQLQKKMERARETHKR
jgi:hypothetical protein